MLKFTIMGDNSVHSCVMFFHLLSFLQALRDNETALEQHRNLASACLKAYKYESLTHLTFQSIQHNYVALLSLSLPEGVVSHHSTVVLTVG